MPRSQPRQPYLVVLYDESLHHLHHLIGITGALARAESRYHVVVLYLSEQIGNHLKSSPFTAATTLYDGIKFTLPWKKNRFGQLRYKQIARSHYDLLNNAEGIIGASFGLERLRKFGINKPRLLFTGHGTGLRPDSDKQLLGMDLILVPGSKKRRYFEQESGLPDPLPVEIATVGYPKFDFLSATISGRPHQPINPFKNDRKTLYYNPHWIPEFSSAPLFSEPLMRWIAEEQIFNLIVSPHPLLPKFLKTEAKRMMAFSKYANIYVDFDSIATVDFSYHHIADYYLGETSSSVFEWLAQDKPILYLNPGIKNWEENPYFSRWKFGSIATSAEDIPSAIANLPQQESHYGPLRAAAYEDTFDDNGIPPSDRAATAILDHLAAATESK